MIKVEKYVQYVYENNYNFLQNIPIQSNNIQHIHP